MRGFYLKDNKGQVLLIVVLTMVVALTVGLSIAARTITNLRISKQNEESQRAFQAAEAGIDQALSREIESGTTVIEDQFTNQSNFATTVTSAEGPEVILNGGNEITQGVGIDVWLSNYPDYASPMGGGNPISVTLHWGTENTNTCLSTGGNQVHPALQVLVLSGDVSNPELVKYVFEPSACNRIPGATASAGGQVIQGTSFSFSATIPNIVNGRLMKVIPIYNSGVIAASSSEDFPSQGSLIESTGFSGDTVRKVVLFSTFPQIPLEIFPYSILSQ